jgi:hypothetical protein
MRPAIVVLFVLIVPPLPLSAPPLASNPVNPSTPSAVSCTARPPSSGLHPPGAGWTESPPGTDLKYIDQVGRVINTIMLHILERQS